MESLSLRTDPDEPRDCLKVASVGTCGFARVLGRGSYKVSPSLKQFASRMLDEGKTGLLVDVGECEGMDSTFMGVLAGISQRLRKSGGSPVVMTGVSDKLRNLMKTLGLNRLVEIREEPLSFSDHALCEETGPEASPLESAEHILEAHETLADLHEENQTQFQDVLEFLREDVRSRKS